MFKKYLILVLSIINSNNCFILNSITSKKVIFPSIETKNKINIDILLETKNLKEIYYNYLVKYNYISDDQFLNSNVDPNRLFLLRNDINKYGYYAEEMKDRFKIFQKNYNLISNYNNEGINFQLDINQYADQIDFSNDDDNIDNIKDINYNMLKNEDLNTISQKSILSNILHPIKTIKKYLYIPNRINWIRYLSPTKNQQNCGSCWAFSSTNCIESLMRIKNYTVVRLSEQELVDFSKENYGCNGGLMHLAFKYIIKNKGLVANNDYPYKGYRLNNNTEINSNNIDNNDEKLLDQNILNKDILDKNNLTFDKVPFSNITKYNFVIPKSKSDLLASLRQGPVSIAIDASSFYFRFYKEGVIDLPYNYSKNINHAVLLTGYERDGDEAYWIIQNSWGETWGDNGFAKIRVKEGEGVLKCQIYGVYPSYD